MGSNVANPTITNCVFWNNGGNNTFFSLVGASFPATYSLFDASVTGYTGDNNLTTNTSPFVSTTSVVLNGCAPAIDAGNNAAIPSTVTTDLYGNPRITNVTGQPTAVVDMGAYEFVGSILNTYYKDLDDDGYSDGISKTDCSKPANYKLVSELKGITDDCDDDNANINPATVWVVDNDNDGYYWGDPVTQCTSPGTEYIIKTKQQPGDCSDNDAAVHTPQTYYLDFDKDGYGNPAKTMSVCAATPPEGYVTNDKDCNDNDAAISPVAVEVCGNKVDDNCDEVVDEKVCYPCQNATGLNTSNITSGSAQLSWSATANPQQWQLEYRSIGKGGKWVDVFLSGNIRSLKINGLLANQSYNCHLRAKCNGKWTDYSRIVSFTTAGSSIASSSTQQSISAKQISGENPGIQLFPNPTRGQFVVELHLANNINTNAKIELVNMMGQIVSAENITINNGSLQKTVTISPSLAPGIYIARIIVNNNTYQARVIYEK